jgi:hypothetical protein
MCIFFDNFFNLKIRKAKETSEQADFNIEVFNKIYHSVSSLKIQCEDIFNSISTELFPCDSAYLNFLNYCKEKSNPDYFNNIIAFVIIFRECLIGLTHNYSQVLCNDLPSFSNDFFIYLEDKKIAVDDYIKLEYVDIMRLFNAWLFKNNLTTIKLELITK